MCGKEVSLPSSVMVRVVISVVVDVDIHGVTVDDQELEGEDHE